MSPDELTCSGWTDMVSGRIFAPPSPTCSSNHYDYFIVSSSIAHAVHEVQNLTDAGTYPHSAVRLLVRRGDTRRLRRTLRRPPLVPGTIPNGPWDEQLTSQMQDDGTDCTHTTRRLSP